MNQNLTGKDLGLDGMWADVPVISCYTREQAFEDGALMDVTEEARAFEGLGGGFMGLNTAITHAVVARMPEDDRFAGALFGLLLQAVLRIQNTQRQEGHPHVTAEFTAMLSPGARPEGLMAVVNAEGVTVGFPMDF